VFGLYVAETLDIVIGAALAAMVMLLTGCLSVEQARRAIRWEIVLVIAASLGVSTGMEQSGASGARGREHSSPCCPSAALLPG
jgi:di/tricarboxylate transporter